MKISHEVFKCLLKKSSKFNDFEYALAPLVLNNLEYQKFYLKQSLKGREVWLDNGVYELGKSLDIGSILKAGKLIEATHIIIPDVLQNSKETINNYEKFKNKIIKSNFKVIVCVQGETEKDLKECYEYFAKEEDIDVVALPFAIKCYDKFIGSSDVRRFTFTRQVFIDRLIQEGKINYNKKHHLLGCVDPIEFERYSKNKTRYWFLNSLDTSSPIISGYFLQKITKKGLEGKKNSMLLMENFENKISNKQKKYIFKNIKEFKKIVKG